MAQLLLLLSKKLSACKAMHLKKQIQGSNHIKLK